MATKFVLDTHVLIWFLGDNPSLGSNAEKILQNPTSELILPAIVVAEACRIAKRKHFSFSPLELLKSIDSDTRYSVFPLDRRVIERSLDLSSIGEMHDQLIVATAQVIIEQGDSASLLTRDQTIVTSRIVPTIW